MECILEAHPVPDVTWHCADKKIEDSKRAKMSRKSISKEMYVLTLEILNPTTDDGGNYRCNAVNMYGESNANIALNFQGIFSNIHNSPKIYEDLHRRSKYVFIAIIHKPNQITKIFKSVFFFFKLNIVHTK